MITRKINGVIIEDFRPDSDLVVVTVGATQVSVSSENNRCLVHVHQIDKETGHEHTKLFDACVNEYNPDNISTEPDEDDGA